MGLYRGTSPVPGTVQLTDGTGLQARFAPDSLLAGAADYRLVVTQAIRDVNGGDLASSLEVPFTTGTATTGSLATVTVTPDSAEMRILDQYWFRVEGRDAAGNVVAIAPAWSVVGGGGTIDTFPGFDGYGLFTARTSGTFRQAVLATAGGISGSATVVVTAGVLATITVTPDTVTLPINGTALFTAIGLDSQGYAVPIVPTWSAVAGGGSISPVQNAGLFTAGTATGTFVNTIRAVSGAVSGSATVVVTPDTVLTSITITPSTVTLPPNGSQQFAAVGRDLGGRVVAISPTWSVNGGGGTIDSTGLFAAGTVPGLYRWTVEAHAGAAVGFATVVVTDPAAAPAFGAVSAGGQHTCAVTSSGAAWCWGDNTHGALGNGTTVSSSTPVGVSLGRPFFALSAGGTHTCGTSPSPWEDEYVTYCWGGGALGQLGDGSGTDRPTPHLVGDSTSFTGALVSAGLEHTCLLDLWISLDLYCWGANDRSQIGDGTTIGRTSPRYTVNQTGNRFEEVVTGGSHSCAEAGGGAFPSHVWYCWGANDHGQLGNGTTTDRTSPVLGGGGMSFGSSAMAHGGVSAGARHTCGTTYTGIVYCWGDNGHGQLGDGTTTDRTSPVVVAGGLSFVVVSAGGDHTCGLTAAGAAYCWGLNSSGQLGDGTTTDRMSPVPVAGGLTFAVSGNNFRALTLSAGLDHTCAITTTGAVYCWGSNSSGQLGNGTTADSAVPVKVGG